MYEIDAIRADNRTADVFEENMSRITFGLGLIERLESLSEAQQHRLRQLVIRASNAERRFAREAG